MEIEPRVGLIIRHEVGIHFGDIPNIASALAEVRANPGPYQRRVNEFHAVLDRLNQIQASGEVLGEGYMFADTFTSYDALPDKTFPTPQWIFQNRDKAFDLTGAAEDGFLDMRRAIKDREWKFPHEVTDPNVLTSALLIEGYGKFYEALTWEPGDARKFVLGFEEVLWNEFRDSELLKDVLPWMIEEREKFSPKMQEELNHEHFLELARTLPKIDVNDPRVQAILAAKDAGDKEAEKSARGEFGSYLNNFKLFFEGMRAVRLNPEEDSHVASKYRRGKERIGEKWGNFLTENSGLLGEIDLALEEEEPFDKLVRYIRDIAFDSTLAVEKRRELTDSLDKAIIGYPLEIDSISYYYADRRNSLLRQAHSAMEAAGIDILRLNLV